jgi:GNAT superfamily N-acetyltransferase
MVFNYVTFEQLDDLRKSHPIAYDYFDNNKYTLYKSCPDIIPEMPIFFYLSEDDKIVSHIGVIPDTMTDMNGQSHSWAWTGGLVTNPAYRGKGLATKLMKQMLQVFKEKKILRGSVYSARETIHIYNKIGISVIDYARRYVFLKSIRPILLKYIGSGFFMNIVDKIYRFSFYKLMLLWINLTSKYDGYSIEKIEDISSVEANLYNTFPGKKCEFNSNFGKLIWKYENSKKNFEFYFIKNNNEEIIGYSVIRNKYVEFSEDEKYSDYMLMSLMDFGSFVQNEEVVYSSIFEKLVLIFSISEANVLEIVSSSPVIHTLSRKYLFMKGGSGMSFTFNSFDLPNVAYTKSLENWHLTNFCGDAFTYK